ncbi:MAG: response regulator [Chloroflexota bacterium]
MPEANQGRPRALLIIDNEPTTVVTLKSYLSAQDFKVTVAATGSDGVNEALAHPPALILLSTQLPDGPGLKAYTQLRARARTAHIPIMFLAELGDAKLQNDLLSAGADDFIPKPFDIDILILRIRNAIKRQDRDGLHHPRSGLPTGRLVQEQIRSLADEDGWYKIDFGINEFSTFRDQYGFMTGEEVISFTAGLLNEVVQSTGTPDDFIGHRDDTDFVIVTDLAHGPQLRTLLEQRFNVEVQSFYSFMEREQGFTESPDGATKKPLMTAKIKVQEGEAL